MRIEEITKKKAFEPYKIVVETQGEHNFLHGLFSLDHDEDKEDGTCYDESIDRDFYRIVNGLRRVII